MDQISTKRTKSNSTVQRGTEQILINWLSKQLSIPLKGFRFCIDGCKMNVDGYYQDENRIVLVEAWAHIGKAKSAQKNKVLTDVLKLAYICDCISKEHETALIECYYLFADSSAAEALSNKACWSAKAGKCFGVQLRVADISDELRQAILQAQKQQDIREQ